MLFDLIDHRLPEAFLGYPAATQAGTLMSRFETILNLIALRANYTIKLAPRHQAAIRIPRISSSIRRNCGSGATHMVRYVSRKGSHGIHDTYQYLADIQPCWIRTRSWPGPRRTRAVIARSFGSWLPYQPRPTRMPAKIDLVGLVGDPGAWPNFETVRQMGFASSAYQTVTHFGDRGGAMRTPLLPPLWVESGHWLV